MLSGAAGIQRQGMAWHYTDSRRWVHCDVVAWSGGEGATTFLTRILFKTIPGPTEAQALSDAEWPAPCAPSGAK